MKFRTPANPSAEMPFLEHLEELRWRILWSLLALVLCTVGGFLFVNYLPVISWLMDPIRPYLPTGKLIVLGVTDSLFITVKLAVAIGFIVASPIIFYHVWTFLSPALVAKERRAIVPALYLGLILFAAGVALAYFVALPFTIDFMMNFQTESLEPTITGDKYFGFVTRLLLAFGVIFEMPVVISVLTAIGLVSSSFLKAKRRYAVAALVVLACVITPGDAITATAVLLGPLLLLYEFSILLSKLVERGRLAEASEDALPEPS